MTTYQLNYLKNLTPDEKLQVKNRFIKKLKPQYSIIDNACDL